MLTVINRPLGHKLNESEVEATVNDSAGDAIFSTLFAHGLVDGDYIYVISNFDSYNGFKYVDSTAYNTFKLKESENGDYVRYIQDATIDYKVSVLQHGYLAVNQPIVYELESDLWPNNVDEEGYTPNTVVSQADEDGNTLLNLSAALSDPTALSWIALVGDGALAGAYQIISAPQAWQIVINLAYSASNSFSGYQIVKYYKNYVVSINVYSGLGPEHRWYDEKPYELAATLQFTPDVNGKVKFSIHEILRGYINTRNNLTLDTLPNNLDFMTAFYIGYFESYDESDGSEITTHTEAETSDIEEFEGHAINASMPFKSEDISHMSDYLNEDVYLAQWLSIQDNPIAIVGWFFDLSMLLSMAGVDVIIVVNGVDDQTIENPGVGVIRVPFEFETAGTYCVYARTDGTAEIPGVTSSITLPALSLWTSGGGSGVAWTTGATPSVTLPGAFPSISTSEYLLTAYGFISGYDYTITIGYTNSYNSGSSNPKTMRLSILDGSQNVIFTTTEVAPSSPGGSDTIEISFTATSQTTHIGVLYSSGANINLQIDSRAGTVTTPTIPAVPAQTLTEEKCITVLEECDDSVIASDDIRLTEDGDFRILE